MRRRVAAMVLRYVVLHLRSAARVMDLFFWPLMELLVWGFFVSYLRGQLPLDGRRLLAAILFAMVFWDILYRAQQTVSLALMEEMWTRNILNLLISPLRTWEWAVSACLYGLLKVCVVAVFLFGAARLLYALDVRLLGPSFVWFFMNLLLMGWAVGLITSALLLRWGHAAEALIWGVPFLLQPFSAVFYPLSVYPSWLKPVCLALPSTYVMEGMRATLLRGAFSWEHFLPALALNAVYLAGGLFFLAWMLERGRRTGALVRLAG